MLFFLYKYDYFILWCLLNWPPYLITNPNDAVRLELPKEEHLPALDRRCAYRYHQNSWLGVEKKLSNNFHVFLQSFTIILGGKCHYR